MGGLSPAHLLIILVIALIVIGPGKLPEVGSAIGKSLKEFKKATGEVTDTISGTVATQTAAQPAPAPQAPIAAAPYQQAPYQQAPYQQYQQAPYQQAPYQQPMGAVPQPGQPGYPPQVAPYYTPQPAPYYPPQAAPVPGYEPIAPAYAPVAGVTGEPPSTPNAG